MRKKKQTLGLGVQRLEDRLTLTANAVAVTGTMITSQPLFSAGEIVGSATTEVNVTAGASQGGTSTNDAPVATGVAGITNNSTHDFDVELQDAFSDPDGNVTDLVFAIVGTPDPTIFQSVSIDSATGTMNVVLHAGAGGQAGLSVVATDADGATAVTDVSFDTDSTDETTIDVTAVDNGDGTWTVSGTVEESTPDDGESDAADVELGGAFDGVTVPVEDDGSFTYTGNPTTNDDYFTTTARDEDGNDISNTETIYL